MLLPWRAEEIYLFQQEQQKWLHSSEYLPTEQIIEGLSQIGLKYLLYMMHFVLIISGVLGSV